MKIFDSNRVIGIAWSKDVCRMARVSMDGRVYRVDAVWQKKLSEGNSTLSELISEGVKEIGVSDSDLIIAGGDGLGWEMADTAMPPLSSEELRTALTFELKKMTPLPIDKLRWGYRILEGGADKKQKINLRLIFVKMEQWDRWCRVLSGLKMVDAIVPSAFCLDPLLRDKVAYITDASGVWHQYVPDNGHRIMMQCNEPPTLEMVLPPEEFDVSVLKEEPDAIDFVQPCLLAAYGLNENFATDVATLVALPEHLKAKRNMTLKIIAMLLCVYIVLVFGYSMVASCQAKGVQIRRIEAEIKAVESEILQYAVNQKNEEKLDSLKEELTVSDAKIPEFPIVLLEITRIIEPPNWLSQSLDWKNGQITFQVSSQFKDIDLAARLEDSPYIGDVMERSSSFNQNTNTYTQRFEMTARFDDEMDLTRLERRRRDMSQSNTEAVENSDLPETEGEEEPLEQEED